jgi:hypothetical protein
VGRQAGMMSRKQEPQFIGEVNRVLVGRWIKWKISLCFDDNDFLGVVDEMGSNGIK